MGEPLGASDPREKPDLQRFSPLDLTRRRAFKSAPMPKTPEISEDRREEATKKPSDPRKAKSAAKEARLAEALRANLRRRKSGGKSEDGKED